MELVINDVRFRSAHSNIFLNQRANTCFRVKSDRQSSKVRGAIGWAPICLQSVPNIKKCHTRKPFFVFTLFVITLSNFSYQMRISPSRRPNNHQYEKQKGLFLRIMVNKKATMRIAPYRRPCLSVNVYVHGSLLSVAHYPNTLQI